jgi:CBS domain containing-hemolysin-like protein
MFLLIFYLSLALVISFLCSMMESVLLSTPMSFLNVKKEKGQKSAGVFIALKTNIERPLAAILSLNTVAHTIGAAGVGAQATKIYGEASFGIVSAILTLLILIISEIIPKTIGAQYWRRLALASGIIINLMIYLTYPLVILTGAVSRLFRSKEGEYSVSREEIAALARIGKAEGIFEEKENRIIQSLMKLRKVRVSEVMTPRVVVATAQEDMTLDEFRKNKEYLYFTRIPVYSDSQDTITGFVRRQTVFEKLADSKHDISLKEIKNDISAIPESQPLTKVWENLLESKQHIALVVDEYGGMAGIVTMEDILETILGLEIVDESDKFRDMQAYARQRWQARKTKYNWLDKI